MGGPRLGLALILLPWATIAFLWWVLR